MFKNGRTFLFPLKCSNLATYIMDDEAKNPIDDYVRNAYEPLYGRRLSDDEVHEIRTNLRAFAEGILAIAERLYGRMDNPLERKHGA